MDPLLERTPGQTDLNFVTAKGQRVFALVHSSRRKFFTRIQFKKAATIATKSADRNTFRTIHLRARPERLIRWTLVPAANTILRMVMEIRNEPLNHRPFALRTDAWFAHIRLRYRIAAKCGNVFLAWTQSVRQAVLNEIVAMDGKARCSRQTTQHKRSRLFAAFDWNLDTFTRRSSGLADRFYLRLICSLLKCARNETIRTTSRWFFVFDGTVTNV
jgi:hypothetical protein